jgi:hypothetical protein
MENEIIWQSFWVKHLASDTDHPWTLIYLLFFLPTEKANVVAGAVAIQWHWLRKKPPSCLNHCYIKFLLPAANCTF